MRIKTVAIKSNYKLPEPLREFIFSQAHMARLDLNPSLFDRVKKLGYDTLRIPIDRHFAQNEPSLLKKLSSSNLELLAVASIKDLQHPAVLEVLTKYFDSIEVCLNGLNGNSLEFLWQRSMGIKKVYYSLIAQKGILKDSVYCQAFKSLERVHVYFPYPKDFSKGMSSSAIARFLKQLQKQGLANKVAPPLAPLSDSRCVLDTQEEYFWPASLDTTKSNVAPRFSVIIPCYNNYPYLKKTLLNFINQTRKTSDYEIIIIDDGSDLHESVQFQSWLEFFATKNVQFKYIYSPRFSPRKMGDARYRAGISRNLGVCQARGELLCFLDSDIIVPKNYLDEVERLLKTHDAVQCRRWDLSREASQSKAIYDEFSKNDILLEDPYWDSFHRDTQDWGGMKQGWKYVCTHSFSLKTEHFKESGWILPSYIYYGFEDTDLGYRLWQKGLKFFLAEIDVYHLFHRPERSEFLREKWKRDRILSKTAEIFFRHQPRLEIYDLFPGFLR